MPQGHLNEVTAADKLESLRKQVQSSYCETVIFDGRVVHCLVTGNSQTLCR